MGNLTIQLNNFTVAVSNASLSNSTKGDNQSAMTGEYKPSWIYMYITPIILLFGLVGNSLSFIVMIQLYKDLSFYLYLAVLALTDFCVVIFGGFLRWISTIGLVQLFGSMAQSYCFPVFVCNTIFSQYSSWITVAVSVDRYIAVCHPLKVTTYCTRKRTIITILCILIAIVALDFPLFCFEWNDDYTSCILPQKSPDFCLGYFNSTDLPTYTLVPICFITVFSVLIVRCLTITFEQRHKLSNNLASGRRYIKIPTRRTAVMVMAVVWTFIILSLPGVCVKVYVLVTNEDQDDFVESKPLLMHVLDTLSVLSHVTSFFLYGLSGEVFRDKLIQLFCRCRNQI